MVYNGIHNHFKALDKLGRPLRGEYTYSNTVEITTIAQRRQPLAPLDINHACYITSWMADDDPQSVLKLLLKT